MILFSISNAAYFLYQGIFYLLVSEGVFPAEESNRRRIQYAAAPVCWYYLSGIISFTPETEGERTSTVQPSAWMSNMRLAVLLWNIKL